jgi:hypothetical protein
MMLKSLRLILISMIISAYIFCVYCDCPRKPVEGCLDKALIEYSYNGEKCYKCDETNSNVCSSVPCPPECMLIPELESDKKMCHVCACA